MGRKKVSLELITNDTVRKTTFRKRKHGLLKKAGELKTLCGVDTCAIIYSPNDVEPHAWPTSEEVHQVIERFHSLPFKKQTKHMQNHDESLAKDVSNLTSRLEKVDKKNQNYQMELLLIDHLSGQNLIDTINQNDTRSLCDYLDETILEIESMIEAKVEEGIKSIDFQK